MGVQICSVFYNSFGKTWRKHLIIVGGCLIANMPNGTTFWVYLKDGLLKLGECVDLSLWVGRRITSLKRSLGNSFARLDPLKSLETLCKEKVLMKEKYLIGRFR